MKISKGNPIAFPELRGSRESIKFPAFAEIKLDGELCMIDYASDHICAINKYGKIRENFKALDVIKRRLKADGEERIIMLCELYVGDGKAGSLYKLLSLKDDDNLNITVFDITNMPSSKLIERKERLCHLFGKHMYAYMPIRMVYNQEHIDNF